MNTLIAPFGLETVREIATVLVFVRFDAEETVFERERIVAPIAILALGQVIADAILATELVHGEVGSLLPQFLHPLQNRHSLHAALEIDRKNAFFILSFCHLLIEDAVLLLIQTHASETIAAPETIFAKLTLATIGTVLAIIRHVAIGAIDALRAPLATDTEGESAAADAFAGVTSIVHVL